MPLVTIVVPMYNTQDYLPNCVESLRKQSLGDIEIILVDDGSPDKCGMMAEKFAENDDRIKVVHRENGGLGPARNSGIEVATGDYVGFVDSDDWVDPEMFEKLYYSAKQNHADICFSGYKIVSHGEVVTICNHPDRNEVFEGTERVNEFRIALYGPATDDPREVSIPISVWNAIYRRDFLEEKNLRFKNIRSEDLIFNIPSCRRAHCIVCADGAYYNYRKDGQPSITRGFKEKTLFDYFEIFKEMESLALDEDGPFQIECLIRFRRFLFGYTRTLTAFMLQSNESSKNKDKYLQAICENPKLREAISNYPGKSIPLVQQALLFLIKTKHFKAIRLLFFVRGLGIVDRLRK